MWVVFQSGRFLELGSEYATEGNFLTKWEPKWTFDLSKAFFITNRSLILVLKEYVPGLTFILYEWAREDEHIDLLILHDNWFADV